MLNMLNSFYDYLAQLLIDFFHSKNAKSGDKFNIQFEKQDQVNDLYEALKRSEKVEEFIYESKYKTFCLAIDGVKIIISAAIGNIMPDFLTSLRNKVGNVNDSLFQDKAILFLHATTLDSILKGTESLQKEGMPFHEKSIIRDIKSKLAKSNLKDADKYITQFALLKKTNDSFADNSSVFEYEDILEVIYSNEIKQDKYRKFGLFYDPELLQSTRNETNKRLQDNFDFFSTVDNIHKYGNPDTDLERVFDEDGCNLLKDKEWFNTEYKIVKRSADHKKNAIPITFKEIKLTNLNSITFWDRTDGETKVKSRLHNIIIFNEEKVEDLEIEFIFDDILVERNIKSEGPVVISKFGKKILTKIKHISNNTEFGKISYQDEKSDAKFEFKFVILECLEKVIDKIKTNYNITFKGKDRFIVYNMEENELVINHLADQIIEETINDSDFNIEINDKQKLILRMELDESDDISNFVKVSIKYLDVILPLAIKEATEKPSVITGFSVWKMKRERSQSFKYIENNKLAQGTQEYYPRDEFRTNLEREKQIIKLDGFYYIEQSGTISANNLDIDEDLKKSYYNLIKYYRLNESTPSLAYYDSTLLVLAKNYIKEFSRVISNFKKDSYLSQKDKEILKLGTIKKVDGDNELILTPLHPINVAYQILLIEQIEKEELSKELLEKLSPIYLLPYIYSEKNELYKPVEQNHSPEWTYYINYSLPRYKGSRSFVSKLVKEKIEEFIEHFSYLFDLTKKSPIKINLINLGDCKEVLQGIFSLYIKAINKKVKIEDLIPIDLYIYGQENEINAFEELSLFDSTLVIKENFGLELQVDDYDHYGEEDILNIFREKVHFFRKRTNEVYEYAHISFYEMEQDIKETSSKVADINTGISLGGLVSGVPSVCLNDGSYRTGFGTKYISERKEILLEIVKRFNALERVVKSGEPYDEEESITTAIFEERKKELDKIYDSSHWVTFIDPKVNLNFFKTDSELKDLLIIHYSDQYTTSSGYDAITVTRKSKQYRLVIEEFLASKGISNAETFSAKVINFFNAINGDWLLRLISSKSQFPREKLSILSAINYSLAYFYHSNIIWVPISLEEILRVSGAAGLTKNEGFFSIKNLGGQGNYSDDLLMVGIENNNDELSIYCYPIEVKIGFNNSGVIDKAIEQAKKTRDLLINHFIENEDEMKRMSKVLYRNFLMQQVIISAEKMKLYEIWPEQNWDLILNSNVRTKLLNDDFQISNKLDNLIGRGAVISFKKDIYFDTEKMFDEVLLLEFSEQAGYATIISNIETLKEKFISGKSNFDHNKLLNQIYKPIDSSQQHNETNKDVILLGEVEKLNLKQKEQRLSQTLNEGNKPLEIIFGNNNANGAPVIWYPTDTTKTMHTNTGIIGTMGTGKTQFTKSLITQLYKNQGQNVDHYPIGILIFDYKGDYIDDQFKTATDAKIYNLFHLPYNPLALPQTNILKPLLPLHIANMVKETISKAFGLGPKQETLLRDLIMEAYEKKGINKSDQKTWNNMTPTFEDVFKAYFSKEDVKSDVLNSALKNLSDFEIFEPDPNKTETLFNIIKGVTVINLSGYDESIQNLVVAITLDIFYMQMLAVGESKTSGESGEYRQVTRMILVDEADNFLSKDFNSLKKILKEGRMFGVGTVLSTQLLSHFSTNDNDYANYILTWIVHNVSDLSLKDVKYIFNTHSKSEEDNIFNKIKTLEKHQSLVKLPKENKPILTTDKAFWQLLNEI